MLIVMESFLKNPVIKREGNLLIREVLELSDDDKNTVAAILANHGHELSATDACVPFELNGRNYTITVEHGKLELEDFECVIEDKCLHLKYGEHVILKINPEGRLVLAHNIPPSIGINVNSSGVINITTTEKEDD